MSPIPDPRTIIWFSTGAASAIAARLALRKTPDAIIALRYSAMQNGHGSYGIYDHVRGGWLRMFVGSYDLAQKMIARIEGDDEPDAYPMHEREASRADEAYQRLHEEP